jgi:hypothetical protein
MLPVLATVAKSQVPTFSNFILFLEINYFCQIYK